MFSDRLQGSGTIISFKLHICFYFKQEHIQDFPGRLQPKAEERFANLLFGKDWMKMQRINGLGVVSKVCVDPPVLFWGI